jgi:tetratricopeptide (TPR) repeat protein/tRNA A-37 threonylcarbamoyl transferase component Bud32
MSSQHSDIKQNALEEIKQRFLSSLSSGTPICIESLVDTNAALDELHHELLKIEIGWRLQQGQRPSRAEYLLRFPSNQQLVLTVFQDIENLLFGNAEELSFATVPHQQATEVLARDASIDPSVSDNAMTRLPQLGGYRVVREIARGGMGIVYQATDTQLGRNVAIKMIRGDYVVDRSIVERFTTEAKAVAKLDHPNIVPVYDFGEFEGQPFFAMAYVDGESLADRVLRDGPLPPATAAKMMIDIIAAVQHAHDRGIIHRDIKPQNILIQGSGKVQVTDFGLAKFQDTNSTLTRNGQILGTPAYMPPEQAVGDSSSYGERADIYSLGATLYYLLTARPPFQAAGLNEILRQVIDVEPIRLRQLDPSLPKDLETICLKCLAKDPQLRYPTASAMGDDLKRWLNGEPILAKRSGVARNVWMWCRRKPVAAGFTATAVLATFLGIMTMLERGRRLFVESEVALKKTAVLAQAEEILENGRELLISEDYEAARAERQKLLGMEPELSGQTASISRIQDFANELDAIRDFEIARVQRCGMPACKFDYVNFSPVHILERLELDFGTQTAADLSGRIAQTDIQEEIIAALDDWSLVITETVNDPYKDYLPKLIEVCNLVDNDDTRKKIRSTLLGDKKAIPQSISQISANELRELKPTSIVFMASALAKAGHTQQAIDLLSEGFLIYPDNFWINLRLAEVARGFRKSLAALRLKHLEVARALRPYNTVLIHNLASEYAHQDRIEDSRQLLNAAIEHSPDDPYLHHAYALLYHGHLNDLDEAVKIYNRNIVLFPDFCQSYLNLAGITADKGDLRKARSLLKTALEIQLKRCEPQNTGKAESYNLAFLYYMMWSVNSGSSDTVEVLRLRNLTLDKLREVLPFDRDGLYSSLLVTALLKAAAESENMNMIDQQLAYLREAIPLDAAEDHWEVLDRLARIDFSKGDLESSQKLISQAAEKLPADDEMSAANVLVFAGIVNAAIADKLGSESPTENLIARHSTKEKAVRYLRQAKEMNFFKPLPFGIMLSTKQEYRPLYDSPLFWELVVDSFRQGLVDDVENAEEPASPAYYFAAQAAIKLSGLLSAKADAPVAQSPFELRLQAHQWITKKISILGKAVNTKQLEFAYVNRALKLWKNDPGWIPVRDVEGLAQLSPAESEMWKAFWKEVDNVQELTTVK